MPDAAADSRLGRPIDVVACTRTNPFSGGSISLRSSSLPPRSRHALWPGRISDRSDETRSGRHRQRDASAGRLPDKFGRYRIIRPLGSGTMGRLPREGLATAPEGGTESASFDQDETHKLQERFPLRGALLGRTAALRHLPRLRRRRDQRPALHLDGLPRGTAAVGLHPAGQAAGVTVARGGEIVPGGSLGVHRSNSGREPRSAQHDDG